MFATIPDIKRYHTGYRFFVDVVSSFGYWYKYLCFVAANVFVVVLLVVWWWVISCKYNKTNLRLLHHCKQANRAMQTGTQAQTTNNKVHIQLTVTAKFKFIGDVGG